MTQGGLGQKVGLDQTVISKLERGDMQETTKIGQLSKIFNVDAYWLATGEGDEIKYCPKTKEAELASKMIDGIESQGDRQKAVKIIDTLSEPEGNHGDDPKHAAQ